MSDDAIWRRLDEHGNQISEIRGDHKAMHSRQQALEERIDRLTSTIHEGDAQLSAQMQNLANKLDGVESAINRHSGGLKLGAWVVTSIAVVSAAVASIWNAIVK